MKYLLLTSLLLSILTPALAELTPDDLNQIRLIIKEEIKTELAPIKEEIKASETRTKEYVDLKIDSLEKNMNKQFESVDKRLTHQANMTYALIALIAIAIIPQYIFLFRSRTDEALKKQVETLTQEIEILKKQRITSP